MIADDADNISEIRELTFDRGTISSEATDEEEKTVYDMYYGRSEALSKIPNHRILAINRGEKEGKLKVTVDVTTEEMTGYLNKQVIRGDSIYRDALQETVEDSYKRLIAPSVESFQPKVSFSIVVALRQDFLLLL